MACSVLQMHSQGSKPPSAMSLERCDLEYKAETVLTGQEKKKKKYWKRKPQNSCLSEQCTLIVSGTQTQNGGWEETAELGSVSILYKLCNNDVLGA